MSLFKKLKKFYKTSPENRMQLFNLLGFIIIPVIGMIVLYIIVTVFFLGKSL